jgi:hypothetical protein
MEQAVQRELKSEKKKKKKKEERRNKVGDRIKLRKGETKLEEKV